MSPQNSQPVPQNPPKPDDAPFRANIVTNIPIHAAGGSAAVPPKNNEDVDKIMRDVGNELKKEDEQKPKHHFFSKPTTAVPPGPQPPAASLPQPPSAAAAHQAAAKPQPAKPKSSVPIAVIFITICATGGLVALAVLAL